MTGVGLFLLSRHDIYDISERAAAHGSRGEYHSFLAYGHCQQQLRFLLSWESPLYWTGHWIKRSSRHDHHILGSWAGGA